MLFVEAAEDTPKTNLGSGLPTSSFEQACFLLSASRLSGDVSNQRRGHGLLTFIEHLDAGGLAKSGKAISRHIARKPGLKA